MNILFIEDERELAATGVAQLELKGYDVFPAYDIAEAQAILDNAEQNIHFVISDHRLPDGMGIQFVIEMRKEHPRCKYAVVSGCLTDRDIDVLEEESIPYYRKPLLYGKVIDDLRRMSVKDGPKHGAPGPVPEQEAVEDIVNDAAPEQSAEAPAKKSGFKFWPFK